MEQMPLETKFQLLTKIELAGVLGVTTRTVEHYMRRGEVPFLRLGSLAPEANGKTNLTVPLSAKPSGLNKLPAGICPGPIEQTSPSCK
jgi:hypothetical protein